MSRALLLLAAGLLLALPAQAKTVVCPGPTTLEGIDVSYWQGTIDWKKVKAAGKKYAIIRAAHALQKDTKFAFNWKECHAQGLHCGVYQYFEPNIDPIAQADLMLGMMGKLKDGDLPPVIDVESKAGKTPAQITAAVDKWIKHVEKAVGKKPMIYTGAYFWEDYVKSTAFVSYPLWHAQYCTNCCPNIANPWKKWAFWQYSSTGKVSGISGNVDLDKWNGNATDLAKFADFPNTCTPGCQGDAIVKADCSKVDCGNSEGTCVNDSLGLRCISKYCPAKGEKTVCPPSKNNALLGTCKDGKLTTGDCSKYGAFCSTAVSPAKCVSTFCAKSPTDKPIVKDVCLPDGVRYACQADGDLVKKPCPADSKCATVSGAAVCQPVACKVHCEGSKLIGTDCKAKDCAALSGAQAGTCVDDAKGPRCVSKHCPALGTASVCLPDPKNLTLGVCQDGAIQSQACQAGAQVCAQAAGGGTCAAAACVPDAAKPKVVVQDLCLPGGDRVHCDAQGKVSPAPCPAGQACVPGLLPAVCVGSTPAADAGSPDAGAADAGAVDTAESDADDAQAADDAGDPDADDTTAATDEDGATSPEDLTAAEDSGQPTDLAGEPDLAAPSDDADGVGIPDAPAKDAKDGGPTKDAGAGKDAIGKEVADAGSVGTAPDAGAAVPAPGAGSAGDPDGGCSAAPAAGPGAGWLLAAALWAVRRRRR